MRKTGVFGKCVVVVFLAAVACGAQEKSPLVTNLEAGKKQVVVAYGTSLTAAGAWVKQLQGALDASYPGLATVVNSGGSGQWSQWGVANLETHVLQKKPDTVFIEFGINDSVARFSCPVELAKNNVETIIAGILKTNPHCEIILMTMTPGDLYPEGHRSYRKNISAYYDMYRAVAREHGFRLIDHYPAWKAMEANDPARFKELVPDSIHPTAAGCTAVVTPAIFAALGLHSKGKGK